MSVASVIISLVAFGQVINMEWAGFWSSHLPRTYADEQLDSESVNPGQAVLLCVP